MKFPFCSSRLTVVITTVSPRLLSASFRTETHTVVQHIGNSKSVQDQRQAVLSKSLANRLQKLISMRFLEMESAGNEPAYESRGGQAESMHAPARRFQRGWDADATM